MGQRFLSSHDRPRGQVYEDVAGGSAPAGTALTYENDWWFENHPGCYGDASDNRWTDNVPHSGDERRIRTHPTIPLVQWAFVLVQARASRHLPSPQAERCLQLARQAAAFGRQHGHDKRTLFLDCKSCAATSNCLQPATHRSICTLSFPLQRS